MSTTKTKNKHPHHTFKSRTKVFASFSTNDDSNVRLGMLPTCTTTSENAERRADDEDWGWA